MGFDSEAYRKAFWREARKTGRTIGPVPYGLAEYRRGSGMGRRGSLAGYLIVMGGAFAFWIIRKDIDRYLHRLRRPTYYEMEKARRSALAAERRRLRKRRTLNPMPSMDDIRTALAHARESIEGMLRLGSLLDDLECYVDNSPYFNEHGKLVGRRGGIRRHLQSSAPDLYARYKTLMRYKVLARKFRQAMGVVDPVPADALLTGAVKGKDALALPQAIVNAAQDLIAACDCSVVSLAAQLTLRLSPDYAPRAGPPFVADREARAVRRSG